MSSDWLRLGRAVGIMILMAGLFAAGNVRADEEPDFDIYLSDSTLTVWLDLGQFPTELEIEQLFDGIDLVLAIETELRRPRFLLPDPVVTEQWLQWRLHYRAVTSDFVVLAGPSDSILGGPFLTVADLRQYLSDSLEISVHPEDSLSAESAYAIDLSIAAISLTEFNLVRKGKPADEAESPVRFLFRQFLTVTGYGRRQLEIKSRSFHLDELARHN